MPGPRLPLRSRDVAKRAKRGLTLKAVIPAKRAKNATPEQLKTARWLLIYTPGQRETLRGQLRNGDAGMPEADAKRMRAALALILEPPTGPPPQRPPFGNQHIRSVVSGGSPGLGKR